MTHFTAYGCNTINSECKMKKKSTLESFQNINFVNQTGVKVCKKSASIHSKDLDNDIETLILIDHWKWENSSIMLQEVGMIFRW